jgi:hypothetical protein
MSIPSLSLVTLPSVQSAEGPAQEYALLYPYILIWTDQVDLWRFARHSSDLTHVATLSEHVPKPHISGRSPQPSIDEERKLLVIPEHFPIMGGPPKLWVFNLVNGELIREVKLYGRIAAVPILYHNGHALTLLSEEKSESLPNGQTSMVLCDIAGDGWLVSSVNLPSDLSERESLRDVPPLILEPIFFGANGDILATSTTRWLGKIDLLRWRGPQITDDQQPDARLELQPIRQDTKSMVPGCYVDLSSNICVLCTHEEVNYDVEPLDHMDLTSVKAIDAETMTVQWTAEPIWGQANHVQHVPTLGIILVFGTQTLDRGDEARKNVRHSTFVAVLDAQTGAHRKLDTIDSDMQGGYLISVSLSAGEVDQSLVAVWDNGDVNIVKLQKFMESGFDRDGPRLPTMKVFPSLVVTADVAQGSVVAVAGAKTERAVSEGSFEALATEEATVFMAEWQIASPKV